MPTKKTQWLNDIQAFTARVGDSNPQGFGASTKTSDWKIWTDPRRPGAPLQSSWASTSGAHVIITITMYAAALSPPEIWSFARSKSVNTNSLQYGRTLTSSVN